VFFFLFRHRPALTAIMVLVLAPFYLTAVSMAADPAFSTAFHPRSPSNDPLNQAAFEHYYNLDHDAAIQDFERILARHPNDPFAVNHLLSAIQVRELYRMGAMNTGDYSNDNFIGIAHRPADPAQKERIKQLVAASRKAGECRTGAQSEQCRHALRPRRDARPVRALHGAHRARLVFSSAQCGGSAPRS
jgi:hypothetical protein